ncbi:serine hydrolase domain-containing protein [Pedobacter ginsengisoli]|uniref:serine hydrolase domain-containing protein n=1 Tax=Pedobacter ginsengisoli TaxID=363852 RepID=UPI00254A4D4B|nr:serine hydrolase [Pedobacter ginsengisoli]
MNRIYINCSLFLLLFLSSCTLIKTLKYWSPGIEDGEKFPARLLSASKEPYYFPERPGPAVIDPRKFSVPNTLSFEDFLQRNNTVAFVIIRNDSLIYEKYFDGLTKDSAVLSFSISKVFTSALIGLAINDQLIGSVEDPVTNYLPEMRKNGFDKVTIKHLLQMTSGIRFREDKGSPFHEDAKFYYGSNLTKRALNLKLARTPGAKFEYASGNTQLLGLILQRALKNKTITEYLQEKIWNPLGMESAAQWNTDRKNKGIEKMFCCLNATARDFAKFGNLYLHKGKFKNKQIVPEQWARQSVTADTTDGGSQYYKYQWWLSSKTKEFFAEGIINQFIYVNPAKNLVMVKLSKGYGVYNKWTFFGDIARQL